MIATSLVAALEQRLIAERPARVSNRGRMLRALAAVTDGRGAILSQMHIDVGTLEGSLARGATDVLVFSGGELTMDLPSAEILGAARLFAVTVRSNAEPLRSELAARGIDLRGGPTRFAATLPPGLGAKDILVAAASAKAAAYRRQSHQAHFSVPLSDETAESRGSPRAPSPSSQTQSRHAS